MTSSLLLTAFSIACITCLPPSGTQPDPVKSEKLNFRLETIKTDISVPWGMAFLPDKDILITDRAGKIRVMRNGKVLEKEIEGVPKVYARGQGGLFDIILHPDYKKNGWIYISYAAVDPEGNGSITYIMRAKLKDFALTDQQVIFKGFPFTKVGHHFGGRMAFGKDEMLYFSIGERGQMEKAQSLETINGKIYRIHDDGSIPKDNPFVNVPNALPAIFSYGHRNPQGLALNPATGEIWETEHGPMGGDELNIIRKGKNYGWPKITYGIDYNGEIISKDTALPGMEQPVIYWRPSIATSNLIFVKGDKYPAWKGNILVCGMTAPFMLERLELKDNKVTHQERLYKQIGRVRNVAQSPDGDIYVCVEGGDILKIIPAP